MTVRTILFVAGLALFAGDAAAQDLAARWRTLQRVLDGVDDRAAAAPPMPAPERIRQLQGFLREAAAPPDTAALLEARNRLGSTFLASFEPQRAETEFDLVLQHAPSVALDLRGHALCGLAEAAELRGDRESAAELWVRIEREFTGTPFGDIARVARRRFDPDRPLRARVGEPVPALGALLDHQQTARRLEDLRGKPALLVCISAADPDGLGDADRVVRAARAAGLGDEQMLAFAIEVHGRDLTALAGRLGWRMPIIASPDGFVGEALLTLEVRGVPATILLAPDGTLLARDLPPRRLRELLGKRRD